SPPALPAASNISACNWQARSQVGWRLMVASSARMSRPLRALRVAPIARALRRNAATSLLVEPSAVRAGRSPRLVLMAKRVHPTLSRERCSCRRGVASARGLEQAEIGEMLAQLRRQFRSLLARTIE